MASPSGNRSSSGGDDRGGTGRNIAFPRGSGVAGQRRDRSGRTFQWRKYLSITKTGNAHLRRVGVEAAWAYRHRPNAGGALRKRQAVVSEEVREIAWKAQHRLPMRYRKLTARGKEKGKVVTAIARERLGFIWAMGVKVEDAQKETERRAA